MTHSPQQPQGVHLVGSVPLENAEQVFRTTSRVLGDRLRRIPDGETGSRTNWVIWQYGVFAAHPAFENVPRLDTYTGIEQPSFRLRNPGGTGLRFENLGYADEAQASDALFARLKAEGAVPAGARFQVSLPTALATLLVFVDPRDQATVEPADEARLVSELGAIAAAIPHDQLAIQWDVAVEVAMLEGVWPNGIPAGEAELVARLVRLGQAVPGDVELGSHLCYGDAGHQHFKQPVDTSLLVSLANGIAAGLTRPLNWLHLPVPRDRSDHAYFAPLAGLKLHPETELYLGLVHNTDGAAGAHARIAAAQRVVPRFGVGTECGMGRRPPESIPALLGLHAAVSAPVAGR